MQRNFDHIDSLNDISAVLNYVREVFVHHGAIRLSYHVTSRIGDTGPKTASAFSMGFDDDWRELYERENFRQLDPIPKMVMQHGAMMTWAEVREAVTKTPELDRYFAAMDEHKLVYGAGTPLFGPNGRDAFLNFDFGRPMKELSSYSLGLVRSVAQVGHQRICVLLNKETPTPVLSERELEVLTWASRGKSMNEIATILDLSPDTVKTYSKRVYSKLEVSDRVGAVIKAVRLGLVQI